MLHFAKAWMVVAVFVVTGACAASDQPQANLHVTIRVYSYVLLSEKVLAEAEQEAARVFDKAGVKTLWVECRGSGNRANDEPLCQIPPDLRHLVMRIVPGAWSGHDSVFGFAFLSAEGNGAYSDVFFACVEQLHREWSASVPRVLGHVMAHEIGHLLLGSPGHTRLGIMQRNWHGDELRRIERGTLFFTAEQAQSMRSRLSL